MKIQQLRAPPSSRLPAVPNRMVENAREPGMPDSADEIVDFVKDRNGRVWIILEESGARLLLLMPNGKKDWRQSRDFDGPWSAPLAECGATDAQHDAYLDLLEARDRAAAEEERGPAEEGGASGYYEADAAFKARVLELLGELTAREAMYRASEEWGVTLPPSYYGHSWSHIHRWRKQRRSA